ncbi:MAG: LacI family DNA-binding transcriptional regulator [Ktedonobacteraceae bacterium]|nr:LacI family DNA-binding transcriptional regulator [Ktedonobacteraceae bacterium]
MRSRSATSNDVARRAGVSRAAVSVVLNGSRSNVRVSEETRQRILAAATELGYSPDLAAQSLRRGQSRIVGYVRRSFSSIVYEQPIPYQIGTSLTRTAQKRGYHIIEVSAETHAFQDRKDLLQLLLSHRVDGVIFDWPSSESEVQQFVDEGLPVVQLIRPQFSIKTPCVTIDPSQGINEALDYLVHQGHRRIAFIGGGVSHPVDSSRLDNFVQASTRHKLAIPEEYLLPGTQYSLAEGYRLTNTLLALATPPTALFVASDILVLGVLRALYQARIRVPEEMSVISYDDTFAAYLSPPLTSVSQPFEEVAERAIALMIEGIMSNGTVQEAIHVVLPTHLTMRESTASPRRKM